MEENKITKSDLRAKIAQKMNSIADQALKEKTAAIQKSLFEFANFMESKIVLLYVSKENEVVSDLILKQSLSHQKIVALPTFNTDKFVMKPLKIDDLDADLTLGVRGILEPNPRRCKMVPIEYLDIVIIPGVAFDEKGGRLGSGQGYYDRFIPRLSATTRKVALAYEDQMVAQVPMESHDRHVDIIITEKRIVYKI